MKIDVLRPSELAPELVARWGELQQLDRAWDSPFLSPHWAMAVERAQGARGVRVLAVEGEGRVRGFMAVRAGRLTAMAAGGPMCDYEALIAESGLEIDPSALVEALGVARLDFSHLLASQSRFAPYAKGEATSWIADLRGGYEAYAADRRASGVSALKDLEKKRRKFERDLGEIIFTARSASRPDFDRVIELKRQQYRTTGQTDVFATDWTRRLTEDLFENGAPGCEGGLFTLHIGGKLAAAHFHLLGQATVHAWLIAHEAEFERYSPGLLLFQDILRWMDDQPFDRLDFGYGDYRFKREFANGTQGVVHGFVGKPSATSLLREAAYGLRQTAESLPLGRVSQLPGKAMRRLDLLRGLR